MKNPPNKICYKDIPADFEYCFCGDCPRASDCLRFAAGQCVPDKPMIGLCVFPPSCADGECPYFRRSQPVRFAWGITPLFKNIFQKHSRAIHAQLYELLGSKTTFYRYNNGRYLLTPEQQEAILGIFERFGYDRLGLSFKCYVEKHDFSPMK